MNNSQQFLDHWTVNSILDIFESEVDNIGKQIKMHEDLRIDLAECTQDEALELVTNKYILIKSLKDRLAELHYMLHLIEIYIKANSKES